VIPVPDPETAPREPGVPRPLLVTADPLLLDELLRLAAAAGTEPEVAPDLGAAAAAWASAPCVLVGGDLAERAARLVSDGRLPRREGVVVTAVDLDDAEVWRRAVAVGAEHVAFLPDADDWLVDRLAGAGLAARGVVLAAIGGRGGAGASVLAAGLALAGLRRGLRTMLVDADPLGGGIDLLMGADGRPGRRWPAMPGVSGRLGEDSLQEALPSVGEMTVLSWDRDERMEVPPESMLALLDAGRRASDLIVVDLPRSPGAAARIALNRSAATFLVVPAEIRACAAAARVLIGLGPDVPNMRVVVRGPSPGRVSPELVVEALGLPFAAYLRAEPGLAAALERGELPERLPGPLLRTCDLLIEQSIGGSRAA